MSAKAICPASVERPPFAENASAHTSCPSFIRIVCSFQVLESQRTTPAAWSLFLAVVITLLSWAILGFAGPVILYSLAQPMLAQSVPIKVPGSDEVIAQIAANWLRAMRPDG